MAGLCGRMHASQPVNRRPASPWTKMSSYTSPWTKLAKADLLGQFCPSWDSFVECTATVYDAICLLETKRSLMGQNCLNVFPMGQFCPTIESMRQIEINHAAAHHAPGKLQTARYKHVQRLIIIKASTFFCSRLALYHIKKKFRMSLVQYGSWQCRINFVHWLQYLSTVRSTSAIATNGQLLEGTEEWSLKCLMANCFDFAEELTALQYVGSQLGVSVIIAPKFHAELAGEGVEYSWGVVKGVYRQKPLQSKRNKESFRQLVNDVTSRDILTTKTVRKLSRRARAYICAYSSLYESKSKGDDTTKLTLPLMNALWSCSKHTVQQLTLKRALLIALYLPWRMVWLSSMSKFMFRCAICVKWCQLTLQFLLQLNF